MRIDLTCAKYENEKVELTTCLDVGEDQLWTYQANAHVSSQSLVEQS